MDRGLVPAASARRRARAALIGALATCTTLSVLGGYLMSPAADSDLGFPLVAVAGLIMFVLPFLAQGGYAEVHDQRYLTARTVSGWRTVDLHRLARISRFRTEQVPSIDLLMLVDTDGVRLMINEDPEVDEATMQALVANPANAPRISGDAADRLGLSEPPPGHKIWGFAVRFFAPFLLLAMCFGPPLLVAWAVFEISPG
ncbi:hypothetical protein LFM09_25665 [Lentzea alba]|uniref:hypothetical protein n=1 Tax=Lentzea alba TaxID=2714351 RepID=UPI0039BEF9E1